MTVSPEASVPAAADAGAAAAPLRLLHVAAPGEVGGLERVVEGLSAALLARGHHVALLATVHPGAVPETFLGDLRARGVDVRIARVGSRAYGQEYRAILDAIRAVRPDVVHTHGFRSDVVGLLAARRARAPVVSTVHGFTSRSTRVRVYERIQRMALRRFDCVIAVSRAVASLLEHAGVRRARIAEIRNAWMRGADPLDREPARTALDIPPHAVVLGWVGRLSVEKAPDLFLEALARCESGVHAVIIGEGPARAEVEAAVASPELRGRVRLAGVVPEAGRLLRAFDALVLSSRTEGTPIVLLEAMAAGVPIIATRVGGVADMLSEDEALLVAPQRTDELARAIDRLVDEADESEVRARRARARLDRDFAQAPWVEAHEAVYRSVAARRRG